MAPAASSHTTHPASAKTATDPPAPSAPPPTNAPAKSKQHPPPKSARKPGRFRTNRGNMQAESPHRNTALLETLASGSRQMASAPEIVARASCLPPARVLPMHDHAYVRILAPRSSHPRRATPPMIRTSPSPIPHRLQATLHPTTDLSASGHPRARTSGRSLQEFGSAFDSPGGSSSRSTADAQIHICLSSLAAPSISTRQPFLISPRPLRVWSSSFSWIPFTHPTSEPTDIGEDEDRTKRAQRLAPRGQPAGDVSTGLTRFTRFNRRQKKRIQAAHAPHPPTSHALRAFLP